MILLSGVLLFYIMSKAGTILIPVTFAFLISLLMLPFYRKLLKWKFPRSVSAILSIVLIMVVLAVIIFYIGGQISRIAKDLPAIGQQFNEFIDKGQDWLESQWGVNQAAQSRYIKDSVNSFTQQGTNLVGNAINTTSRIITFILLLVIPLFFFLYYHDFLKAFVLQVVRDDQHQKVKHLLADIENVVLNYITGLFIVIIILATLNTIGLKIIGIEFALFFGLTAALLNIIPFVGVFIGSLLPILYAIVTMDSLFYPVAIAVLFWFIQFLEGNIITPNIVGGKVSLNPFAAILALFVGAQVWGAAGMILFIPLTAILKVVLDNVPELKPYGFLLGEPGVDKNNKKGWIENLENRIKRMFSKKD